MPLLLPHLDYSDNNNIPRPIIIEMMLIIDNAGLSAKCLINGFVNLKSGWAKSLNDKRSLLNLVERGIAHIVECHNIEFPYTSYANWALQLGER